MVDLTIANFFTVGIISVIAWILFQMIAGKLGLSNA